MANEQTPQSFDGTRLAPEVRRALADQSPEIRAGVKAVADQPASPGRGDDRSDWKQARK
jgi:hypothetical protein